MIDHRLSFIAACALLLFGACGGSKAVMETPAKGDPDTEATADISADKRAHHARASWRPRRPACQVRSQAVQLYERCLKVDPSNSAAHISS
ncbi:MAG: hypothetical protein R2818_07775 [Flavobacteriales bacterium]